MRQSFPLDPAKQIERFLEQEECANSAFTAVMADPDALAIANMSQRELEEELGSLRPRLDDAFEVVRDMVGLADRPAPTATGESILPNGNTPPVQLEAQPASFHGRQDANADASAATFGVTEQAKGQSEKEQAPCERRRLPLWRRKTASNRPSRDHGRAFRNYGGTAALIAMSVAMIVSVVIYHGDNVNRAIQASQFNTRMQEMATELGRLTERISYAEAQYRAENVSHEIAELIDKEAALESQVRPLASQLSAAGNEWTNVLSTLADMSDRFGKLETRTTHLSDLLQAAAKPEQIAVSDIVKQLTAALSKKPDQEGSMVFYVPKEANDFVATPGSAGGFISNAVSSEPHHIVVFDAGGNGQDGKAVETAASGIIADWNHMDPKAKAKIGIVVEDSKVTPDDLKAMINILNNANEK